MRKIILALAGAAALTLGSGAQAAISINSCTFASCQVANGTSGSTIGFSDISVGTSFNESINFSNTVAGLYSITFGTSSPSVDILTAVLSGDAGTFTLTGPQGPDSIVDENFSLAQTFLPVGNFMFNTTGTRADGQVGSIAGTLTVVNSAVPEPATWALMLLGFGGMGFSMRRNRSRRRTLIAQIA